MPETIRLDDPAVLVRLHRSSRARRFTLSLRHRCEARLTAPAHAPASAARRFLDRHRDWLRAAIARAPDLTPVGPGAAMPIAGHPVTLRDGPTTLRACQQRGDVLLLPPGRAPGRAVAAFLRLRTPAVMVPAARRAAVRLGREAGRISLRDTRSRWGSCTAKGDLMFSWRLAMAPEAVQVYVANHEAAHLVEMNHGAGFWRLVEMLDPDWQYQRRWLRQHGPGLHRFVFAQP